jgi:hypothetical protein
VLGQSLNICDASTGEIIAVHTITQEKGRLIKSKSHSRQQSQALESLKQEVILLLNHQHAHDFIEKISQQYPRYQKEQFSLIKKLAITHGAVLHLAFEKCITEKLYSANSLRDLIDYYTLAHLEHSKEAMKNEASHVEIAVQKGDIQKYLQIIGDTGTS